MSEKRLLQSPVLIGRDEALAVIDRRIAEAAAGRGGAILVSGEAGIGKSRVVRTLLLRATKNGFRSAKGDINPQDQLVSLASISDLARSMLEPGSKDHWGDLGNRLLSVEGGKGKDSLASRRLLVHEVADLVAAAITLPTVLVFEDLHWGDELTLEIVGELARLAAARPLLVVATYRPEELPIGSIHREWISRLMTQRLAESLKLERLTPEETAQAATLILGTGLPASREVAEAVYLRTNGIPLHIEELLAAIDGAAADGRAIRDAGVPATIEDAVVARLGRLSADAQVVARASSIMGRCFAPEAIAGILDRPVSTLDDALDELVEASILDPFNVIDDGYFDFRHQLLRDAIYATVPRADLRRMHARAAEFGDALYGVVEVHKALHYERAGMQAEAFRAALAGANAAAAVSSRYEAFELYRRAVANLPRDMPAGERGDVYQGYAHAATAIDNVQAMEEAATLARQAYLEAGRTVDAAGCIVWLQIVARRDVRSRTERQALLSQAIEELRPLEDSPRRSAILADIRLMQCVLSLDSLNGEEVQRLAREGMAFAEAAGDADAGEEYRSAFEYQVAIAGAMDGDAADGIRRMLEIAREARDARLEGAGVTSYRIAADVAVRMMEYDLSELGLSEGIRYADEIEQSYCRRVMSAVSAMLAWATGDWDAAVAIAELELVDPGSRRSVIGSRAALGFVSFGRGDIERARMLLDASLGITRPSGEIELILPALWGLAETALVDGDPARALDHCLEAAELAGPAAERALLVPFVVTGVRGALLARRPEAAERWLDQVTPMLERWTKLAAPALAHADGLIQYASGATVASRQALERAVAGWDGRQRVWESTWARLDLAATLVRGHRYGEALPLLREVLATARRLGSLPLLRRAEEIDHQARSRAGDSVPWHPLTSREFEVARLIATGLTNNQIAEELSVSPKTVSAHVEHMLAKLGAGRRAEIASWVGTTQHLAAGGRAAQH